MIKISAYFKAIVITLCLLLSLEILLRVQNFSYNIPFHKEEIPFIHRKINSTSGAYLLDLDLFWKFTPNTKNHFINSLGFRNEEFTVKKNNVFRIIAIGDSCTAGHWLALKDTYSKQLERKLNNAKKHDYYQVINAGVPGYTSLQGKRYFKKLLKYSPDMIIVFLGCNDQRKARYADKDLTYTRLLFLQFRRHILSHFKLFVKSD